MYKLVFSPGFIDDLMIVNLETKQEEILLRIQILENFPEIGSLNLPASIIEKYGNEVRRLAVNPFDVIYKLDASTETVYIAGMLHQREAW